MTKKPFSAGLGLLFALAVFVTSLVPASARASPTQLNLVNGSTSFGATHVGSTTPFTDLYEFDVTSNSWVNGSAISIAFGSNDLDFVSITLRQISGSPTSGPYSFIADPGSTDPLEIYTLTGASLLQGRWALDVTATVSGSSQSYGATLVISQDDNQVGEPTTMALAGLALLALGLGVRSKPRHQAFAR